MERGDEFGGSSSQVRLNAALDDPEQSLVGSRLRLQGTFRPAMRPLHGEAGVSMVIGIGTLVEGHDDICAEILLNGN
jgi:hypothetical protein